MRHGAFAIALVLAAAAPAWAEDAPKGWSGEAELGLVATDGNTQTQNLNAKAKVAREGATWRDTLAAETVLASNDDGTTAERYFATGKADRKLGARSYVFVTANWEKDRFSGYDYRVTEAVGYGHRVVATDAVTLNLEAGPGARHSHLASGETEDEFLGRLAANLAWKVSGTATFTEELTSDLGEEATVTRSVTALKAQVVGQLATKLSVTFKHTSDTPPGVKEADVETALTLVYGF